MGLFSNLFASKIIQVSEPVKFPNTLESQERLYKEYAFVKIVVINKSRPNYSALRINDELRFVQEPNSDFDEQAVAVYDGGVKLGYLSRGISQDMTNDFINQRNTILAKLTYIDSAKNELKMDIAYYRNPPRHKYSTSIQETTKYETLAPQYLKQIEESINIINNTADPKTFFKRYIFAIDRLSELSKMESKISFTGQLPSKFKCVMIEKKQASIIDMIDRSVQKTKEKLLSLKTEKGKTNNINQFRTQFEPFEEEMLPSTLDYLNNVYTELSNSIK